MRPRGLGGDHQIWRARRGDGGAAGAVGGGVRVGDLILGRHLIQHDLGTREGRRAETTGELRASLATALAAGPRRVLEGTILTGDKACVTLRRRIFLRWWFRRDRPLAVDMESASAGVVAAAAGLPTRSCGSRPTAPALSLSRSSRRTTVGSLRSPRVVSWNGYAAVPKQTDEDEDRGRPTT